VLTVEKNLLQTRKHPKNVHPLEQWEARTQAAKTNFQVSILTNAQNTNNIKSKQKKITNEVNKVNKHISIESSKLSVVITIHFSIYNKSIH